MSASPRVVEPYDAGPARVVDHPSGYLALSPNNSRYAEESLPGFIAYRECGKHLVRIGMEMNHHCLIGDARAQHR